MNSEKKTSGFSEYLFTVMIIRIVVEMSKL